MFKDHGKTWIYLVGIVIMFAILITLGATYILPVIFGNKSIDLSGKGTKAPEYTLNEKLDYLAVIKTNFGNITIDLYEKNAPNNVNNFAYLAKSNYYNGTKFHRLIPGLLIQGGDRNSLDKDTSNDGKGNPGYVLKDEINWPSLGFTSEKQKQLKDDGYKSTSNIESKPLESLSVAMANGGPNTNGSQFFIVIAKDTDSRLAELNGRFTVIGKVIEGQDVLNQIANVTVDNPNLKSPRPTKDIVMEEVTIFTR